MYKVYCLKNKHNEIIYVGQTTQELNKRLIGHRHKKDFNLDDDIKIELIAEVPTIDSAFILEAMLINQYNLVEKGLNKSTGYTEEHRERYRLKEKDTSNGFYKHNHTDEMRKEIGERSLNNQYALGNKSRTGLKNSEAHKQRISEVKSKQVICLETGVIYMSIRKAAKDLGLNESKISAVCRGSRESTGNKHFRFV